MSEAKRAQLRNRFFGFVFQFYYLLEELNALENVMLPCLIAKLPKSDAKQLGLEALQSVGLSDRLTHKPSQLSGGQQQRVALARACVLKPKMILADEPTGNLDQESGKEVLEYLMKVVEEAKGSLMLVTHNKDLLGNMDETFELKDGTLQKVPGTF